MRTGPMILKILSAADWARFQREGVYRGSPADLADGYVHFSTAAQVAATLAKHYRGREGLVLLAVAIDALGDALGDALRWEPARNGDLFPHLYGPLPLHAVHASGPITLEAGLHVCPPEVLQWA